MGTHFEEPREARASLPEQVQQAADALAQLLEKTAGTARVREAVRVACEAVSRRLRETRLTIALVGDPRAGRRTLVNALLGDRVLPTNTPRRGATVTIVRRAPSLEFAAYSLDGREVARLSRKMPDRGALFEKSRAQIDHDTSAAEELAARLEAARGRVEAIELAPVPSPRGAALLMLRLWSWILGLFLRSSWLKRLSPGTATEGEAPRRAARGSAMARAAQLEGERAAIAAIERELAGMPGRDQLAARAQKLRLERQKYEAERRAAYLSQVHDFDGTDVGERIVEYPAQYLPEGVTLVDLPCPPAAGAPVIEQVRSRVAREVDALVLVVDAAKAPGEATAALVRELSVLAPVLLVVLTKADGPVRLLAGGADDDVRSRIEQARRDAFARVAHALDASVQRAPSVLVAAENAGDTPAGSSPFADHFRATIGALFERLEGERPVVLAWREAMRMRVAIAELTRVQETEVESCRKRLSALESKRFPDPAEFRGQLLSRLDGAIEQGADDVLAVAVERLHDAIEGLRSDWKGRIASCTTRGEVDACVAAIDESAARSIAEALEQTAEIVARELHDVTETLEASAIEEIHAQYRLVRRGAEALAPVASELTREDLERELLAAQPFEGAMAAFEKRRVGYGLGGAAAGAMLGTLIAPGIGTAVGAVLGVFAGFLKGTDSLKQECIAKIEACLNDAGSHAQAQLRGRRTDLSRVVRVSLDGALEEALGRLNDAIARLIAVERRAIDRERAKVADLISASRALEECDERLERSVYEASRLASCTSSGAPPNLR